MEKDPDTTVKHDIFPFVKIYESGRMERRMGTRTVPAGTDPATGVTSKDIQINPSTGVFARLYLPPNLSANTKLPLLVYIHGGAFVIESAASPTYHNYLNTLVSKANILVVSVDYRRAPEHPLPAAYDDCWEVLSWAANGSCPDEWVSTYGDLGRLYLAGDSSGGNAAHHMAVKAASEGIKIKGLLIFHPWFGGGEPFGAESEDPMRREINLKNWRVIYPESPGLDDHYMNPMVTEGGMDGVYKCEKVLVEVAENDELKNRGKLYYEKLEEAVSSGKWDGRLEFYEVDDEHHVFFLRNSNRETEVDMMQRVVNFID